MAPTFLLYKRWNMLPTSRYTLPKLFEAPLLNERFLTNLTLMWKTFSAENIAHPWFYIDTGRSAGNQYSYTATLKSTGGVASARSNTSDACTVPNNVNDLSLTFSNSSQVKYFGNNTRARSSAEYLLQLLLFTFWM